MQVQHGRNDGILIKHILGGILPVLLDWQDAYPISTMKRSCLTLLYLFQYAHKERNPGFRVDDRVDERARQVNLFLDPLFRFWHC